MRYFRKILLLLLVAATAQLNGQPADCLGVVGGSALPGTACDDGNASTLGDFWTGQCDCFGLPVGCDMATTELLPTSGVQAVEGISPNSGFGMWYALVVQSCSDVILRLCSGSNITGFVPEFMHTCPLEAGNSTMGESAADNGCGGVDNSFLGLVPGTYYFNMFADSGAFTFEFLVYPCGDPCTGNAPTASATASEDLPALVCQGEEVLFDGSASSAVPGHAIVGYTWDFDDGVVDVTSGALAAHAFTEQAAHQVLLTVTDDFGCAGTIAVPLAVWVSTTPDFTGTSGGEVACLGDTVNLSAVATAVLNQGYVGTPVNEFIPDDIGVTIAFPISVAGFPPGAVLGNVDDLGAICLEMEHSYMGDFVVELSCPNGQSVTLHEQGGGNTYLGEPVDDDFQPDSVGVCYEYCFSPTATNGTWVDNAGFTTLPAGTYESVDPLDGLVGCPMNGVWTLSITDMFGSDNGYLCDWGFVFDEEAVSYTPVLGLSTLDSAFWSGSDVVVDPDHPLEAFAMAATTGNHDYVFSVTDDFGCTYETTISVLVPELTLAQIEGPLVVDGAEGVWFIASPELADADSIVWSVPDGWAWNDAAPADYIAYMFPSTTNGPFTACATAYGGGCAGDSLCFTGLVDGIEPHDGLHHGVELYPNPAAGTLFILRREADEPLPARVVDATGREVASLLLKGGRSALDVSGMASGSYRLVWGAGYHAGSAPFIVMR